LARPTSGQKTGATSPSVSYPGAFGRVLQQVLQQPSVTQGLTVSQHAEKRLQERGIPFGAETRALLAGTIDELRAKGARDSLVITNDGAFLVNVPSRTLVTAMDIGEMQDRIITQIDSVSIKTR
jgi:flagellar operon protein